jgi:hypothetical protein
MLRKIPGTVARGGGARYDRGMTFISACSRFSRRGAASAVLGDIFPVSAEHLP